MNAKIILISVIASLTISSCTVEEGSKVKRIDIEGNLENFQPVKLSEICSEIEYIQLESSDSSLVGQIKFIDISDRYILTYDSYKCILFDKSGKFIRQISRRGRGPGEYTFLGQVKIFDDEIFLPEVRDKSFKIHDNKGRFIEQVFSTGSFSQTLQACNFMIISDSLFLVQIENQSGREENRISLINRIGEVIKNYKNTNFFNLDDSIRSYSTDKDAIFYKINTKIRYKEKLNDTVWQVEQNNLVPVYVFDRGEFGTPSYIRGWPPKDFAEALSKAIDISNVFETNNYIIIKTYFKKQFPFDFYDKYTITNSPSGKVPSEILGIFDKEKDDFYFVKPTNPEDQIFPTGFENDIDGGVNFIPQYKIGDTTLISWIYPYRLKIYTNSKTFKNSTPKFPEKKKQLEQLANSLNENDNPVLMLVKLKN